MEMGAALTVLVFSQYSLPVSTSMCITGATVGVGLCNGTLKAVNFHRVGLLVLGKSLFCRRFYVYLETSQRCFGPWNEPANSIAWIMTIPIAGTLAGVLMGLFLNAPHFS